LHEHKHAPFDEALEHLDGWALCTHISHSWTAGDKAEIRKAYNPSVNRIIAPWGINENEIEALVSSDPDGT
jgi:hypothetical protein